MNAEFLAILDFWEREKGISKATLLAAVEEALVSAAKIMPMFRLCVLLLWESPSHVNSFPKA